MTLLLQTNKRDYSDMEFISNNPSPFSAYKLFSALFKSLKIAHLFFHLYGSGLEATSEEAVWMMNSYKENCGYILISLLQWYLLLTSFLHFIK